MKRTLLVVLLAVGVASGVGGAADGPMADAGLDQSVSAGTTVQLDGSGSANPEGSVHSYEWTITGPDGLEVTSDCPDCERTRFRPERPGRYEATLSVTDGDGSGDTDTLYVYVDDAGPEVELAGDTTPDVGEPVTFRATATSPGSELDSITWAVEDAIVATGSLDGTTDGGELTLALTDPELHRVQVVVEDATGRSVYDELHVSPRGASTDDDEGTAGWSDVDTTFGSGQESDGDADCESGWDCGELDASDSVPIPDPAAEMPGGQETDPEQIRYVTDGYEWNVQLEAALADANFPLSNGHLEGLDDGENAPWNFGLREGVDAVKERGSNFIWGQEEETVSCEIDGGTFDQCRDVANELEQQGGTANVDSPATSGTSARYGLVDAKRVEGQSPVDLDEGETAEVTVVTQQERDGVADVLVEKAGDVSEATEGAKETAADTLQNVGIGSGGSDSPSSDDGGDGASSVAPDRITHETLHGGGAGPDYSQPSAPSTGSGSDSQTNDRASAANGNGVGATR